MAQLLLDLKLAREATFANYIGSTPQALQALSGMVYLWGRPGTGCSHLLQAACHEVNEAGGQSIYLAEPGQLDPALLNGLESLDLVCIDQVEQVLGDHDWQRALFHLFNGVKDRHGRLYLAGQAKVSELKVSLNDLLSRIRSMDALETLELDDVQKRALMQQRASQRGFVLSDEVVAFIMARSNRDQAHLLEILDALDSETLKQRRAITIPFVKQTLLL